MTKKYKILLIIIGFVILVGLGLLIWSGKSGLKGKNNLKDGVVTPEFMSAQDKEKFQVPQNLKAQIINKDEKGEITVYKIVNTDNDVIPNPSKIPSITPRQNDQAK